jgi:ribosome-associated protein
MDQTELLVKKIVEGLQEKKGKEIAIIDLTKLSGAICQYMVICEGNTPTQVGALSDSVWDYVRKELSDKPISIDGEKQAQWIGMDYGTVLVHIFIPELRSFYNLENLWADSKVIRVPDLRLITRRS